MNNDELTELLKSRFGSVKRANGDWVMIKCPTCTPRDANKRRRGINLKTLATKCFICEIPRSIQELLGGQKIEIQAEEVEEKPEHPQARIIPCKSLVPINELAEDHPARQFFIKDHLLKFDSYWENQKIGYITKENAEDIIYENDEGRRKTKISPADSIVFPVYYKSGIVGWQLRFIPGTKKFRYLHIFKKGDYLYNYDSAINYKMVVVTEGVKKALKFDNGVGTFGKGISENQIQKLLNWDNIVFMYDGEDDTQEKTKKLVAELNIGSRRCINIDPRAYGFDSPDEMPEIEAQKIVFLEWKKNYPNG